MKSRDSEPKLSLKYTPLGRKRITTSRCFPLTALQGKAILLSGYAPRGMGYQKSAQRSIDLGINP
jgi:hypothetical protein